MGASYPYPNVFAGYEEQREQLKAWTALHYVHEFRINEMAPCRLLDAGCGEGFWGDLLHDICPGLHVIGFDREAGYIAAGQEKYPALELFVGDLDFAMEPLDCRIVFCRAISHFYRPTLDDATVAIEHLLAQVPADGLLLLSIYTDGSGKDYPGQFGGSHRYHTIAAYRQMIADAGAGAYRVVTVGNYLQIGVHP